jgi:hypothetical protein
LLKRNENWKVGRVFWDLFVLLAPTAIAVFFTPAIGCVLSHQSIFWLLIMAFIQAPFNWVPRHESVLGDWRYSSTYYLSSALDGGEWSASRSGRFTPQGKSPWYPLGVEVCSCLVYVTFRRMRTCMKREKCVQSFGRETWSEKATCKT